MPKKLPYTAEEWALARELFEAAKAAGTVKSPPGLFAVEFSDGRTESKSRAVAEGDYLRDARRQLADRKG